MSNDVYLLDTNSTDFLFFSGELNCENVFSKFTYFIQYAYVCMCVCLYLYMALKAVQKEK